MSYDQQQNGWQSGGLGDAPERYPELGVKLNVKGVKIDTKSPAAHIRERMARAEPLFQAALAGDNNAWQTLWTASWRPGPVRLLSQQKPVSGTPGGWARVGPQITAMLEKIERARKANQVPGSSGAFPAPGGTVTLPGAGPVPVPPILQPGAAPTGPNAPAPDSGTSTQYYPAGGGGGQGYDSGGAPGAPTAPKLADMFGGKLGMGIAAAGVGLTLVSILSDNRKRRR